MATITQLQPTMEGLRIIPPREPLVVAGPPLYFTSPQSLLAATYTADVWSICTDEIHNWSAYLMAYDKVLANTSRWHKPVLAWAELPRSGEEIRGISHNFLILDETWDQDPQMINRLRERVSEREFYNEHLGVPYSLPAVDPAAQQLVRDRIQELMARERQRNSRIFELPRPADPPRYIGP